MYSTTSNGLAASNNQPAETYALTNLPYFVTYLAKSKALSIIQSVFALSSYGSYTLKRGGSHLHVIGSSYEGDWITGIRNLGRFFGTLK